MSYPTYNSATIKKVKDVLKSGKVNYWTGKECKTFETEFSNYICNKYAISVCNGSVALEIALKALQLKKGDQIIVSPRSFVISASCVINLGLVPVFADVDENGNLSLDTINKVYNKKVKAIILVHLNGLSCDMDPIIKFSKKNKVFLIEDCSQAHGAIYKKKKVGSFGDISTWSFCQDKIISTGGEGGMISTNNKKLWLRMWSLKDHGKNFKKVFYLKHKTGFRWLHDFSGSNHRMTEMQAVIGRQQLKLLDKQVKKRNFISNLYINNLKDFYQKFDILKKPNFKCESCPVKYNDTKCSKCINAFYRLNFFINKNKINQLDLIKKLNKKNINCGVGSCPEIYMEKVFQHFKFRPKKRLQNAKLLGETSITFPIDPYKNIKKIKLEISCLKKILKNYL